MQRSHTATRVIALIISPIFFQVFCHAQEHSTVESRQELAIERLGPPEFNAENNKVINVSPQEKALLAEMMPIVNSIGNAKDIEKNSQAAQELNVIIKKHPQYSDAYFLRATASILGRDHNYPAVLRDIDIAIKLHSARRFSSAYDSTAPMYSLRSKVDILDGNFSAAMNDLETAITIGSTDITDVFNTGGTSPEENANRVALQRSDLESLVTKFPRDYRSYLFRGLFYFSFTTYNERYYAPAIRDLNEAQRLKPSSWMPSYFLGILYHKRAFWTKAAWADVSKSGGFKDKMNAIALQYFNRAVKLDPKLTEGYAQIAEGLFELKRYKEAIPAYDKVISLDPARYGAYNDRGLAKTYIGDYYGAIADFSHSIELQRVDNNSYLGDAYENRADAYMKVGDFKAAIEDYSRAIGMKFASQVFLMSIRQIRDIYPEFANISNQDLLEGLRQKYYPNMSAANFDGQYQKNKKPFEDFVLAGLYEDRGDSYLYAGQCTEATEDYARALHDDSTYTLNRWKPILKTADAAYFIDAQTLDCAEKSTVSLWLKIVSPHSNTNEQIDYQIDCVGRRMRSLGSVDYNSLGTPIRTGGEEGWQVIAPDSVGEKLHKTVCATSSN